MSRRRATAHRNSFIAQNLIANGCVRQSVGYLPRRRGCRPVVLPGSGAPENRGHPGPGHGGGTARRVAFLAGLVRVPASALELAGTIPLQGPAWYVVLQGVIGAVQFVIGIAMLVGYRRSGLWGNF